MLLVSLQPSVTSKLPRIKLSKLAVLDSLATMKTALISCADSEMMRIHTSTSEQHFQTLNLSDAKFHNTLSQMYSSLRLPLTVNLIPMTTRLMVTSIHSFLMPAPSFWLLMVPPKFRSRVLVSLTPDSARLLMIIELRPSLAVVVLAGKLLSLLTRTH
jgi:hypothetical protein